MDDPIQWGLVKLRKFFKMKKKIDFMCSLLLESKLTSLIEFLRKRKCKSSSLFAQTSFSVWLQFELKGFHERTEKMKSKLEFLSCDKTSKNFNVLSHPSQHFLHFVCFAQPWRLLIFWLNLKYINRTIGSVSEFPNSECFCQNFFSVIVQNIFLLEGSFF